ncbi:20027_t:CDS:2, partial [Rhizophagus irregularis]
MLILNLKNDPFLLINVILLLSQIINCNSSILKFPGSSNMSNQTNQLNEITKKMANVKQWILALELLDQRMTKIEHYIKVQKLHSVHTNISSKLDTLTTRIGCFIESISNLELGNSILKQSFIAPYSSILTFFPTFNIAMGRCKKI